MHRRALHITIAIVSVASLVTINARAEDERAAGSGSEPRAKNENEQPAPPAAATTATPAPAAAAAAPAKEESSVYVHVTSPRPVAIRRADTDELVCTSPCDKPVPSDVRYTVGGERPSSTFVLAPPANGQRADVRVKPGSRSSFWLGVGGLTLGSALIAAGTGTLIYARNNQSEVPGADGVDTDNSYTDRMVLGTTLIIGGVVAGLWGGATVVSNWKTSVRGNVQTADNKSRVPDQAPARAQQAQASSGSGGLPKPVFVSILSGAF